jgi:fructan beta-fructosidase
MKNIFIIITLLLFTISSDCQNKHTQTIEQVYHEINRQQIHFSPVKSWMNDPNGMFFYKDTYHLFFQYYPNKSVWGPMHWGHATSKDLIHWMQQPIALYPDSLGYIFSGSAVVDYNNTSGFGKNGITPLVAIFTHHNIKLEKAGSDNFQYESLAYSLDEGKTWTKYSGNPVLKNPGITDFRDPKVMWFEEGKKWIMTLATKDCVTFYSSADLKNWTKESQFGNTIGCHGGVWECPDLFSLNYQGKKIWVLLVSINPGGPNGGSATQYFTGNFNGKTFTPLETDTKWIDYGRDNYAGVTWSNTKDRKIFIGWMSDWQYAQLVPTQKWRSTLTVPRELALEKVGDKYFVASQPVKELDILTNKTTIFQNIDATHFDLGKKIDSISGAAKITMTFDKLETFSFVLSNDLGEKLIIGYDKNSDNYYINRIKSGKISFEKSFAGIHTAPRRSDKVNANMTLVIDRTSVELFADSGLTVITDIFFPNKQFNDAEIESVNGLIIKKLEFISLKSIWQ